MMGTVIQYYVMSRPGSIACMLVLHLVRHCSRSDHRLPAARDRDRLRTLVPVGLHPLQRRSVEPGSVLLEQAGLALVLLDHGAPVQLCLLLLWLRFIPRRFLAFCSDSASDQVPALAGFKTAAGKPLLPSGDVPPWKIGDHPLDRMTLLFIGLIFLVFAINKERMLDFTDPSDHFYHMAVAQKILEYGGIPLWDDWEFAPVGRPHLYPPLLHLLIAFFAGTPDQILLGFATIQMLLYPTALLSYWFLYRTFLSPSLAYLSIIALSMEFMFTIGCLIGLPASVVNVLWSLILLSI